MSTQFLYFNPTTKNFAELSSNRRAWQLESFSDAEEIIELCHMYDGFTSDKKVFGFKTETTFITTNDIITIMKSQPELSRKKKVVAVLNFIIHSNKSKK